MLYKICSCAVAYTPCILLSTNEKHIIFCFILYYLVMPGSMKSMPLCCCGHIFNHYYIWNQIGIMLCYMLITMDAMKFSFNTVIGTTLQVTSTVHVIKQ